MLLLLLNSQVNNFYVLKLLLSVQRANTRKGRVIGFDFDEVRFVNQEPFSICYRRLVFKNPPKEFHFPEVSTVIHSSILNSLILWHQKWY